MGPASLVFQPLDVKRSSVPICDELVNGDTIMKTLVLVRTPKTSNLGAVSSWKGDHQGKLWAVGIRITYQPASGYVWGLNGLSFYA